MTGEYIKTVVSLCNNCGEKVPGHVRKVKSTHGQRSWGCPACGFSTDPGNLRGRAVVDVEGVDLES